MDGILRGEWISYTRVAYRMLAMSPSRPKSNVYTMNLFRWDPHHRHTTTCTSTSCIQGFPSRCSCIIIHEAVVAS